MIDANELYFAIGGALEEACKNHVAPCFSEPLSRRDQFAMAAMTALVSDPHWRGPTVVSDAVMLADLLITELAKEPSK